MAVHNPPGPNGGDDEDDLTLITAEDIADRHEYNPKNGGPNNTDYNFPECWGLFTQEMRAAWFTTNRVGRQAMRQDTAVGRRARKRKKAQKRVSADQYRVDDDQELK